MNMYIHTYIYTYIYIYFSKGCSLVDNADARVSCDILVDEHKESHVGFELLEVVEERHVFQPGQVFADALFQDLVLRLLLVELNAPQVSVFVVLYQ